MSTKTVISCDRCGYEIDADRTALDVRCGPLRRQGVVTFDLCSDCLPRFLEWLHMDLSTRDLGEFIKEDIKQFREADY